MSPTATDPLRPHGARPRWRKLTRAILFWSALMLVWAIARANSAQNVERLRQ
jgi:hypothetical protein